MGKVIAATSHIRRLWGNVPVKDAKIAVRLFPTEEDRSKASKKNPGACVMACAANRNFGTSKILFFRQLAYVELHQPDGTTAVERFVMEPPLRTFVANYDIDKPLKMNTTYTLLPPPPSKSLEQKRQNWQRWLSKPKNRNKARAAQTRCRRRAKLIGRRSLHAQTVDQPKPLDLTGVERRQGVGMVHFVLEK